MIDQMSLLLLMVRRTFRVEISLCLNAYLCKTSLFHIIRHVEFEFELRSLIYFGNDFLLECLEPLFLQLLQTLLQHEFIWILSCDESIFPDLWR